MSCENIINTIGIFVNIGLTVWIVRVVQKKLTNDRSLKDYLIQEVKTYKDDYRIFLSELCSDRLNPKNIMPWLKLMNINITSCMEILSKEYDIQKDLLAPYENGLRELIDENEDFIRNFNNQVLQISPETQTEITRFQQLHSKKFNEVILLINKA